MLTGAIYSSGYVLFNSFVMVMISSKLRFNTAAIALGFAASMKAPLLWTI